MPRPSNTDERRAQIADGLIAVMAKHGYDGASIAEVARHAGLTTGLVHYHFKNKLEILIEVVRILAARHQAAVDAALAAHESAAGQLGAFIDVHLGVGQHANPDALACWILVTAEAVRQPKIRREVDGVLAALAGTLEEIIARGQSDKQLARSTDARTAAAALLATIQGYFVLSATARDVIPPGSAAAATRQMAEGLVGPIRSPRGGRA